MTCEGLRCEGVRCEGVGVGVRVWGVRVRCEV